MNRRARRPTNSATTPHSEAVARLALDRLGVITWEHDKIYGLVADASAPHGYRLVGAAESLEALARQLQARHHRDGSL